MREVSHMPLVFFNTYLMRAIRAWRSHLTLGNPVAAVEILTVFRSRVAATVP